MKEIKLDAVIANVSKVTDWVNEELDALGCSFKTKIQIDIAIDELFSNIALYAYAPNVGDATLRVEAEDDPRAVVITFIDSGKPFNPLFSKEPDVHSSVENRRIGGLGIFMVKKSMDDVQYEYKDGLNILSIKKKL